MCTHTGHEATPPSRGARISSTVALKSPFSTARPTSWVGMGALVPNLCMAKCTHAHAYIGAHTTTRTHTDTHTHTHSHRGRKCVHPYTSTRTLHTSFARSQNQLHCRLKVTLQYRAPQVMGGDGASAEPLHAKVHTRIHVNTCSHDHTRTHTDTHTHTHTHTGGECVHTNVSRNHTSFARGHD